MASSEITNLGEQTSEIAITTRCAMPPLSSCGKARKRRVGSGMCTAFSMSSAISFASARPMSRWARATAAICLPTGTSGSSSLRGFGITMAMSLPRTALSWFSESARMSLPSNWIAPLSMRPGWVKSPITARASVVLPEPDSPTSPTISPVRTLRSRSRTACTDSSS